MAAYVVLKIDGPPGSPAVPVLASNDPFVVEALFAALRDRAQTVPAT